MPWRTGRAATCREPLQPLQPLLPRLQWPPVDLNALNFSTLRKENSEQQPRSMNMLSSWETTYIKGRQ